MRRSAAVLTVTWVGVPAAVLLAQPYQIQQGNVLDASPQLGSAGFNMGARQYQINAGNRIVTGNVSGGAGFRGYSPISDPSSFGLRNGNSLPSDSLYGFRRDTFNAGDVRAGVNLPYARSPYYSSSSAIANTGAIAAGLNRPGTSQLVSPYVVPRADLRTNAGGPQLISPIGSGLSVAPRVERLDSGRVVNGAVNQRLLGSPLFAGVRAVPVDELASQAAQDASMGATAALRLDQRLNPQAARDDRVKAGDGRSADSPLSRILGTDPTRTPGESSTTNNKTAAGAATPELRPNQVGPDRVAGGNPRLTSPTQAGDTFAGMRQMTGTLAKPVQATPPVDTARPGEALVRPLKPDMPGETPEVQPGETLVQGLTAGAPIRSFVGVDKSALNRLLAQAEASIHAGQYYRAAGDYEAARTIAPDNPLPLLGRSLALLGAGDYMTSAMSLFQAIDLYQELADFPVDLPSFIPDLTMLDRRRADLEQRLSHREDYRLRFLLGYAEYTSNLQKLGLQDMQRAVESPEASDSLRRFVSILAIRADRPTSQPAR